MRIGSVATALIGLSIAGGSVYYAKSHFLGQEAAIAEREEAAVVRVIAAAQDIPFGHTIKGHMLTTIAWPTDAVPSGVFTDFDDVLPAAGGEPRRARRALAQGELILQSKLSEFGEKVTIVQTLGENTRAMAIKVDAETAVGGFVTPGDFVDVVLTQGRSSDLRAVTILQNIRVLGVDQKSDEQIDEPGIARTVTVEVTPEQGQRLALAQKAGTLSLTLRTLEGPSDAPIESLELSDLLGGQPDDAEAEKSPTIVVRRGTEEPQKVEIN